MYLLEVQHDMLDKCYATTEFTRLIHGIMQSGWYRCLQGKHTIVSSFVMSASQTAHTGLFATNDGVTHFKPISDAVGCR